MNQQQVNTKDRFLSQEISRHGGKPRSINSLLKENQKEKEMIGYSFNLRNLQEISDFIFTNDTQLHILDKTEVIDGETVYVACNALLNRGSEIFLSSTPLQISTTSRSWVL